MVKATGRYEPPQCEEHVGTFAATWSIKAKQSRCLSPATHVAFLGNVKTSLCGIHANSYRRYPGWRVEPIGASRA